MKLIKKSMADKMMKFIFFCFVTFFLSTHLLVGAASKLAHYGFMLTMPCDFEGNVEIHLQHDNDTNDYIKSVSVKKQSCSAGQNLIPVHMFLSPGKWKVKNLSQKSKTYPASSQSINRNLSFTIQDVSLSKPFFYIGGFEWQFDNKKLNSKLFFIRDFILRDLRKSFKENQIYNGYSGDRIVRDKVLGTVSVLFRKVDVTHANKTSIDEFQKRAVNSITLCVRRLEVNDPLVAIDGNILLYNDPKKISLNQNELKFLGNSETVQKFQQCLATELNQLPSINSRFVINAEISSL